LILVVLGDARVRRHVRRGGYGCEERQRIVTSAGSFVGAVGIEVAIGPEEGLPHHGAVRVALPRDGKIFCTWMVTLDENHLIEWVGVLSPEKLRELDNAMQLAAIE
jgi:mRNA interferase MazF